MLSTPQQQLIHTSWAEIVILNLTTQKMRRINQNSSYKPRSVANAVNYVALLANKQITPLYPRAQGWYAFNLVVVSKRGSCVLFSDVLVQ